MKIYTLRMPKDKAAMKQSHIFEATPGAGKGCICLPKSLCQAANTAQTVGVEQYMCLSGEGMWEKTFGFTGDICPECLAALPRRG